MIRNYFKRYDTLTKELYVPEDKAKELIIAIYQIVEEQLAGSNRHITTVWYDLHKKSPYSCYKCFSDAPSMYIYHYIIMCLIIINLAMTICDW